MTFLNRKQRSLITKIICIILICFLFYLIGILFTYLFIDNDLYNIPVNTAIIHPAMIGYI